MASNDNPQDPKVSSRLLKLALSLLGSREALATALEVHPSHLGPWLAGTAFPPPQVFEKVLDVVLDLHEKKFSARDKARAQAVDAASGDAALKPRVLVADTPEGCAVLAELLGQELELVTAHTRTAAVHLLHRQRIALIVCGQHLDDSQMMRFLEHVKADERIAHIPFIGVRATGTHLSGSSLAAMRDACEALGAVGYVDLPEDERRDGKEVAAVRLRDAVMAALRLPFAGSPLRVLVADDNADAAHTLGMLLEMAGHEVQKAKDGAETMLVGQSFRPRVAVLDVAMPNTSGFSLARRIRSEPWGEEVTLIAVTGYGRREDAVEALRAGFDYYFRKPVKVEHLLDVFPS